MAEAREYTVKEWKVWEDRDTEGEPLRDKFGNYKGSVTFEEYNSEPIDATFKEQPNPGDKKYGSVEPYKTQQGKTRLKFRRADRPLDNQQGFTPRGGGSKPSYQPRDDAGIKAQFAIKAAIQYQPDGATIKDIEEAAVAFFKMVDRVKGSDVVTDSQGQTNPGTTKEFSNMNDQEFANSMAKNLDKGLPVTEEFNMEDIPF